jgi:predicted RNA-binding Zn-ribbon protein involved in translation (DUF1610 family)
MSNPIYLNGKPLLGHITYMCPECGEELHKNQRCPHCNKKAIGRDLLDEDMDWQQLLDDWAEQLFIGG